MGELRSLSPPEVGAPRGSAPGGVDEMMKMETPALMTCSFLPQ